MTGWLIEDQAAFPCEFKDRLHQSEFVVKAESRELCASFQDPSLAIAGADISQSGFVEKRFNGLDVLDLAFCCAAESACRFTSSQWRARTPKLALASGPPARSLVLVLKSAMRRSAMRCIIRGARENNPTDPKMALKSILKSRFTSEVTNGTTIVSTSTSRARQSCWRSKAR